MAEMRRGAQKAESCPAATQDVGVEAIGAAQVVEFALIHEGKTLVAS